MATKAFKQVENLTLTMDEARKALKNRFGQLSRSQLETLATNAVTIIEGLKGPITAEKKTGDKFYNWFRTD
jgi:hypothetical protein